MQDPAAGARSRPSTFAGFVQAWEYRTKYPEAAVVQADYGADKEFFSPGCFLDLVILGFEFESRRDKFYFSSAGPISRRVA